MGRKLRYESFIGFRLLVFENRLRDRGTIIASCYSHDGVITFTTETGDYSFFYGGEKLALLLSDGRWKFFGHQRWAYVVHP